MGRPITAEDLWAIRRVGQPAPGPAGDFVVVPVTTYDVEANEGKTRLYRVAGDGSGEPIPLTSENTDSSAPEVSPDGRSVAFIRKVGGYGQLHVIPLDGGEARRLTDLPLGVLDPRWLPDGSGLVVIAPVDAEALTIEGTREAREDERKVKAIATEDRVYRFWNRWLVGGEVHHFVRIDLDGGDPVDLTPAMTNWLDLDSPAGTWDISPDGAEIAFAADISEPPHDRLQTAILTVPTTGGEVSQLVDDLPAFQIRPRYSPDGRYLLYGMQREWDFYADRVRLVGYDRSTGAEMVLTEDWDHSASGWEFAGDTIILAAEERGRLNLYSLADGGEPRRIVRGGHAHGPRPAGRHIYFRLESLREPARICRTPVTGGAVETVADFNADLLADIEMGRVEDVEFTGAEGDQIQMFVVYPPGFDGTRTYPLLHSIHGGPHGIFGDQFHYRWSAQAFAAPGYVVALANFHGSTSFGQDFAASIHGAWGDMPGRDIMAATDALVDGGSIDPDRVAIAGGSYGGYLVAWLLGQTDRFAAAIVHAGVTNLLGQNASDITQGRARNTGGTAWENLDAVQRWSPTNHLQDAVTPTLVIHGEKDYRVVVTQGLELYGILKAKGVDARLVYYPDEGHWILKPQNSLHWYGEVFRWLERYLR